MLQVGVLESSQECGDYFARQYHSAEVSEDTMFRESVHDDKNTHGTADLHTHHHYRT